MNKFPERYHAYLLRLWPEAPDATGPSHWRATLENARTGERLGFSCLEQLFAHLVDLAERGAASGADGTAMPPE